MPAIDFDRFHRYADLTAILEAFAAERPDLVSLESIGKSHEGRDIWVLTVICAATGPAAEKPAFWVDGNIHSTEVAGSAANLYFLHTLLTQYGKDPEVTRALDTRAFYVCPRINPDGAEWALADKPRWVRASTRAWPWDEDEIEGLTVEDVDGDGRILQMRIRDSNGLWKDHPEQPGLRVRRDPTETGGTYYRVIPEGTMEGYDGFTLRVKKRRHGIDLNRNFHANWRQEFEQLGAGSLALPEDRREGDRADRLSGDLGIPRVPLSPEAGDRRLVRLDLRAPRHLQLGDRDLEPDARGGNRELPVHRVVPRSSDRRRHEALSLEPREARRSRAHRVEAVRASAAGSLEIGGWNRFHAFGNPLPQFLERKVVRGVIAEITVPEGASLVQGKRREEIGQLEGKWAKHTGVSFWPDYHVTDDRAKIEWIVRAKRGDRVQVLARHDRAGTVRASVALG